MSKYDGIFPSRGNLSYKEAYFTIDRASVLAPELYRGYRRLYRSESTIRILDIIPVRNHSRRL